jgi:hypothetical protein
MYHSAKLEGINHLNFFIAFYFTVFVDSFLFAINGLLVTGGIIKTWIQILATARL